MSNQCPHCGRFHDDGLDFGRPLGHVSCCELHMEDILTPLLAPYYNILRQPQLVLGNATRFADLLIVAKPNARRHLRITEALVEIKRGFLTDGDVHQAFAQAEDQSNARLVDSRVYGDYFLSDAYDRQLPVLIFPGTKYMFDMGPPENVGALDYD